MYSKFKSIPKGIREENNTHVSVFIEILVFNSKGVFPLNEDGVI